MIKSLYNIKKAVVDMHIIPCPKCGKDINNDGKNCPYCGFTLLNYKIKKPEYNAESYENMQNKRIKLGKIGILLTLLSVALIIIIGISLKLTFMMYIGFVFIIPLVYFMLCLKAKYCYRHIYDSNIVIYYNGLRMFLYIDDELKYKTYSGKHLSYMMPSGKIIWARTALFDGTIKVGLGEEKDSQII